MDLTRPEAFPPIPFRHPDEDTMELYALGRLAATEAADLETHLFVCVRCQEALTETEEFVGAMKAGLAARTNNARSETPGESLARRMGKLLQMPSVAPAALAGLLAAVALVAVDVRKPEVSSGPTEVELRSLRGGDGGSDVSQAEGPARAPLHLVIQSSHLTAPANGHIDIVDQAGNTAWTGPMEVNREDAHPAATVDKPLGAGDYWVRLYGGTTLLQEYGLRLR